MTSAMVLLAQEEAIVTDQTDAIAQQDVVAVKAVTTTGREIWAVIAASCGESVVFLERYDLLIHFKWRIIFTIRMNWA